MQLQNSAPGMPEVLHLDLNTHSTYDFHQVVYHRDLPPKASPITSGYRVALIYEILLLREPSPPPDATEALYDLSQLLDFWREQADFPDQVFVSDDGIIDGARQYLEDFADEGELEVEGGTLRRELVGNVVLGYGRRGDPEDMVFDEEVEDSLRYDGEDSEGTYVDEDELIGVNLDDEPEECESYEDTCISSVSQLLPFLPTFPWADLGLTPLF